MFWSTNLISSLILIIFYWNAFQRFLLSKSSLKDRNLTPDIAMGLNRCRCLGNLTNSLLFVLFRFPGYYQYTSVLCVISSFFALYHGWKYMKGVWIMNGAEVFITVCTIVVLGYDNVLTKYPYLPSYMEKVSTWAIVMNTWGFLWYYLWSRDVCPKDTVRHACYWFHVPFMLYFLTFGHWHFSWWYDVPPVIGLINFYLSPLVCHTSK
eukprot:UN28199